MNSLKFLLATSLISITIAGTGFAAQPPITRETRAAVDRSIPEEVANNPRLAAERFIQHVNYARISLSLKNPKQAQQHIAAARDMTEILKKTSENNRTVHGMQSGRLIYKNDPTEHSYVYPI